MCARNVGAAKFKYLHKYQRLKPALPALPEQAGNKL
jgi:hypothetical protein